MRVMNTPCSVDIAITSRCNLRCAYCSHFTSAADVAHDLPKEEWLEFFQELNHCAVTRVTLEGGEPFCRGDLRELIEGIVSNRMRFSILTNGSLIDDEIASYLSSTGRCDMVQVSVDGSGPRVHDAFRGDGSFARALAGIHRLQKHRVPVSVRVTIHRENLRNLTKTARLLLDEAGLQSFSTNGASYMGRCRSSAEKIQLTAGQRTQAMETLLDLQRKYKGRIHAAAGPLAEGQNWLSMERARREGRPPVSGEGRLSGCGGAMCQMAVRSDGVMIPCSQMSHIELGRIHRDSLKAVWQDHPELHRLRERSSIPLRAFAYCQGCDYVDYCTGNCPALAYTMTGEENHPSPEGCLKRFLEEGGRLPFGSAPWQTAHPPEIWTRR